MLIATAGSISASYIEVSYVPQPSRDGEFINNINKLKSYLVCLLRYLSSEFLVIKLKNSCTKLILP